jgi:hypothetical protein
LVYTVNSGSVKMSVFRVKNTKNVTFLDLRTDLVMKVPTPLFPERDNPIRAYKMPVSIITRNQAGSG